MQTKLPDPTIVAVCNKHKALIVFNPDTHFLDWETVHFTTSFEVLSHDFSYIFNVENTIMVQNSVQNIPTSTLQLHQLHEAFDTFLRITCEIKLIHSPTHEMFTHCDW